MARPKGKERGLFERPKGSDIWWILYYDRNGQRHREKGGTKTQARALYQFRQAEKLQGKLPELSRDRLTLRQLAEHFAPEEKASKKSWKGDRVHARAWVQELGDMDIRDIKPGDIEAAKGRWLSAKRPLSPATVNRRLAYLKTLLGRAVRDNHLAVSPMGAKRVKLLPEPAGRDRILAPEEEAKLLAALSPMMARAATVALYTGLRQAELIERQRGDVDLSRRLIRLRQAKGGPGQWVHLSDRAAAALQEQLDSHKEKWLWPNDGYGEGHLRGDTFLDRVKAAAKFAGLKGVLVHTFRHTYISRLCMLGVPLPTVQRLARHKSITMTLRYAHLCPDHTQQALAQLDGFCSTNGAKPQQPPEQPPRQPPD